MKGANLTISLYHPNIFVEVHGIDSEKVENMRKVIKFLEEKGYTITHVESGERASSGSIPYEGHLYATKN